MTGRGPGTGIFASFTGYEVITGPAAVLIFERVAMLC
jgi:hypothetical protein